MKSTISFTNNTRRLAYRILALIAVASTLVGCGGGGSATTPSGTEGSDGTTGIELTGSIVKGLVSGATVHALCHDQEPAQTIGTATSDAQATYLLTTTRACADIIELQVSGGSYVDEATGQTVTGSLIPWMRSVVDTSSGGSSTRIAIVTPITDLLYSKTVAADGTLAATTLAEAAQQLAIDLKLLTGSDINPVSTVPSIGNGPATDSSVAYSVVLAAVSKLSNGSADGVKSAVESLKAKGFGKDSPLSDAMRFIAASNEILGRIGVSQNVAGNLVIRAESFVAIEALLPLSKVPDSSGLSCEPLKIQDELEKLVSFHSANTSTYIFSSLSLVLSGDSYIKALEAWKARCPSLADALNIMIIGEKMAADSSYADFLSNKKPLRECAFGVVSDIIVRGTGQTICVIGDGTNGTVAFILSSTEPAANDSSMSTERCIALSSEASASGNPLATRYAIFQLRGTKYMFCGSSGLSTTGGTANIFSGRYYGFAAWLDHQNIGYYPGAGSVQPGGETPSAPGNPSPTPTPGVSPSYEELAQQSSRLFTGKNFDVRGVTDNLDLLFPSGIAAGTEPSWPGIRFGNFISGIGCVNFGLDKYLYYLSNFQQAKTSYQASDYEAVGRRGYEIKINLAIDNLIYWYDLRTKVDPVNNPTLVCFRN